MKKISLGKLTCAALLLTAGVLWFPSHAAPPVSTLAEQTMSYAELERTAPPEIKAKLLIMRRQIAEQHFAYEVGYTEPMHFPLKQLCGFHPSRQTVDNIAGLDDHRTRLDTIKPQRPVYNTQAAAPNVKLGAWDYRSIDKVTRVRSQGAAGDCWDFAACGALEAGYCLINNEKVDVSEQHVLDCSGAGTADSGDHVQALGWLVSHGVTSESIDPYTATQGTCNPNLPVTYQGTAFGYVVSEVNKGWDCPRIPTVTEMKQALVDNGPIVVAILATDNFQAYTTGTFKESLSDSTLHITDTSDTAKPQRTTYNVNHSVLIIGWDDAKNAWIIKNSWGWFWGDTCGIGKDKGYAYVDYGTNNIGAWACWVGAATDRHGIPIDHGALPSQVIKQINPEPPVVREGLQQQQQR